MAIVPVAKYATGAILFAIAANRTRRHMGVSGKKLPKRTSAGAALSSSLPRPRLNRTASMHSVEAVFVYAPDFSAKLSTANPPACG